MDSNLDTNSKSDLVLIRLEVEIGQELHFDLGLRLGVNIGLEVNLDLALISVSNTNYDSNSKRTQLRHTGTQTQVRNIRI